MPSEAQRRANQKYDESHTQQFKMKLNIKTDADIIARLEQQPKKQSYIKALIREDIKKNP